MPLSRRPGARAPNTGKGAAYVFTRSGTTWSQHTKLTDGTGASGDNFGGSVAINGSTAMVGATDGASFDGVTYVFTGV